MVVVRHQGVAVDHQSPSLVRLSQPLQEVFPILIIEEDRTPRRATSGDAVVPSSVLNPQRPGQVRSPEFLPNSNRLGAMRGPGHCEPMCSLPMNTAEVTIEHRRCDPLSPLIPLSALSVAMSPDCPKFNTRVAYSASRPGRLCTMSSAVPSSQSGPTLTTRCTPSRVPQWKGLPQRSRRSRS